MADQITEEQPLASEEVEIISSSEDEMDEEDYYDDMHEVVEEEKKYLAEEKKAAGNTQYTQKNYLQALELYSSAIELCPDCAAYYGNRSATYVMLKNYSLALEDARRSVQIDPTFVKGHLRIAKCYCAMGEIAAAINTYQTVLELEPMNKSAQVELHQLKTVQNYEEQGQVSYDKQDFRKVVFCMDRCIECSPGSMKYKIRKAECLALLKRYQESQEIVNDMLRLDSSNADAIYVRGMCLYYQDNVDKAFQHFQQVLRLAPDHAKARTTYKMAKSLSQKKEEGNQAFRVGKLQLAYDTYTEALSIDPLNIFTNSKLYCNRATVLSKQNRHDEAVEDCTKAIELDESYIKAYQRRAKCYLDKEMYEESVRDYEKIFKMDKSREHKKLLNDAKLELKKSKRKDYYKLLGIQKTAGEDDIKKAYKKRAMLHHPDRHSNATDAERKEQEKKFKEIGEAYAVLSDAKKRDRYDSGQDLEDMGNGYSDMDPNHVFQAFFGGGGGGFPGMGGMGGGGHGHSHGHGGFPGAHFQQQQQGFPGGFSFQFG